MSKFKKGDRVRFTDRRIREIAGNSPNILYGLSGRGTVTDPVRPRPGYVSFIVDGHDPGDPWTQHISDIEHINALDLIREALVDEPEVRIV